MVKLLHHFIKFIVLCTSQQHFLQGYHKYEGQAGSSKKGGCGIFIYSSLQYIPRVDLDRKIKNNNTEVEMKWVEVLDEKDKKNNKIFGVIYRHPRRKD